ncbi:MULTISPECIES: LuxR C-terminal-related transcriptional regulator [unclassified Rhodococcus (in: high G+C Gram-positive bacteria)]|uniref:helix-turn-helix transcriptional regulator n=1 Tax=unclassified Rhodococcus (in: high G+C Gram-positive bacteria) TaxID=192944 RepID=UPI00163AF0F5|nr:MULTISPECIES: LuxR C-terminal-related transcriptional regulator [unclassified Rhodococcus (in: high G+C Gram-positive bacteria)]MBC2643780.1 response regulator transcription factor [Rhodococcus sp. 3A]MBC2891479.1 response regulator transcription factor [Rhodococcus sp. 4CII]
MVARAPSLLRPRDGDALRGELRTIAAHGIAPVLFGGEVQNDTLHLSEFVGTRTNNLKGLAIPSLSGLGGRVVAQRAPASVHDYGNSSSITHHYDRPVLSEGLRSILAVPVMVRGTSRAVLYAAIRDCAPIGDRTADIVVAASRRLGTEIAIRDEVDRRLEMMQTLDVNAAGGATSEELRDIHAELRSVAQTVADSSLQARLRGLSQRLAGILRPTADGADDDPAVHLTPREIDVLSHVALGCTNSEAAQRLSVGPETVKSYLRSAMSKLDARSRHEAVVTARRLGLLP